MGAGALPKRYDVVARSLHWLSALAILLVLPIGLLAARASSDHQAVALLRVHVPLGLLILALMLARLAWRRRHVPPAPPSDTPRWQVTLARVVHVLLYALPIVIAASGIGLMALSGAAPLIFGRTGGRLPDFSRFPPMTVHATGALALVGLLALHVAAVAYHQFVRRDRTLARMGIGAHAETPR